MGIRRLSRRTLAARRRAESALAEVIGDKLGHPIRVVLTRNRSVFLTLRRDPEGRPRELRMHVAAFDVTPTEIEVLAAWVKGAKGARDAARMIFDRRVQSIALWSPPREGEEDGESAGPTHGHHDLFAILHELRAQYFPKLTNVLIAWSGRLGDTRRARLGWWSPADRVIRIHRCLDHPDVPDYFIASVVHHELCHAALGQSERTPTGKRRLHGRTFRDLERRFPDLQRALAWERSELPRILFE